MSTDGLITLRSSFGPEETMNRLEAGVTAKGMAVFARRSCGGGRRGRTVAAAHRPVDIWPCQSRNAADAIGSDLGHRPAAEGAGLAGRVRHDLAFVQRS